MADEPVAAPVASPTPSVAPVDSLRSPQFIIAVMGMVLVGAVMIGVFKYGSQDLISTMTGGVVGTVLGSVTSFYLGSSVGGQRISTKAPPDVH